jgi:dihydroorotase
MALAAGAEEADPASFDILITGGRVIDPLSGVDALLDIGISNGRVVYVGEPGQSGRDGLERLDVTGHVVSPGFIDVHVHGQNPLSSDFMVRDGVTTALDLELGAHGVADFLGSRRGKARIHYGVAAGHMPARLNQAYGISTGHLLTRGSGFMAAFTRFLQRWVQPTGWATETLDADGIAEIVSILEGQLDEGGVGIGMGLAYTPGATVEEVRAVFELAKRRGVPCFVHLRSRESPTDTAPIELILEHARVTGAALHVLHINSASGDAMDAYLDAIEEALLQGVDVSTEVYPYTASSTSIESEVFSLGWRERSGMDYGDLQWVETGERLTEESFARYRKQGGVVIAHGMKASNVKTAVAHPLVMIASDGMPMYEGGEHPRSAGSHARVLGRYVREQKALTLRIAIDKLSAMPAKRLEAFVPAMKQKGRLSVGAHADITIFDPETVIDRATYEDSHQASEGIPHVLVAGRFVVRDGQLVEGAFPGQPIRAGLIGL